MKMMISGVVNYSLKIHVTAATVLYSCVTDDNLPNKFKISQQKTKESGFCGEHGNRCSATMIEHKGNIGCVL